MESNSYDLVGPAFIVVIVAWFGFLFLIILIISIALSLLQSRITKKQKPKSNIIRFIVSGFIVYITYSVLSMFEIVFIGGLDRGLFFKFLALQIATYIILSLTIWNRKLIRKISRGKLYS